MKLLLDKSRSILNVVICGMFVLSATACSILKAKEAADAGFLDSPEIMQESRERFPFHKVWLKNYKMNYSEQYSEIIVAAVDVQHMLKHSWLQRLSLEGEARVQKDAKTIAEYMKNQFEQTIRDDKLDRFKLVTRITDKTLIVELAIVELVPTKVWLNISGNIASFFLPGSSVLSSLASSGSIAFEGRFRDGKTGEVIAMFKDRESDQISPIGIQDATWYFHAKDEIDDWAGQFLEILETEAEHQTADSYPLTFRIW